MTFGAVARRRLLAGVVVTATALTALPAGLANAALDPDLIATLELREGFIDYELELGTLHFFDEEGQPLAIQVIDGCAVNDHYWTYGAGLSGVSLQLSLVDLNSGKEVRPVLPAFDPGAPVGTVLDTEALEICGDDVQVGGLPPLDATVTFDSVEATDADITAPLRLLSDGSDETYQRIASGSETYRIIHRHTPVAAIDESLESDRLLLIAKGRLPGSVEGVVFSGDEGMLPSRQALDKVVKELPRSRVRRATELARNGRKPNALIKDLGLRGVERIHYIDLDFETLGSEAYLTIAGWIKGEGELPEPPALVEERFSVELIAADGSSTPLPLVGPFVGSDVAGSRWEHGSTDARVQIVDQCRLSGSLWTWAGVRTDEPLELVITDNGDGGSITMPLAPERRGTSSAVDSSGLSGCP